MIRKTFYQYVLSQFNKKTILVSNSTNDKKTEVLRIPSSIPLQPSKFILAKLKFYKKNQFVNSNKTYVQAFKDDIIKIKDAFSKLLTKKIIKNHDIINNKKKKIKLRISMTTKGLSKK